MRLSESSIPGVDGTALVLVDPAKRSYNILNMRSADSPPSDVTARARIRDGALALFAERGEDAVTIRQIAERAEVSPGLVVHHYGSKAGLREAVVDHVKHWMDELIDSSSDPETAADMIEGDMATLGFFLEAALPPGSPIPAYLRRLFLAGDPAATELLSRWHDGTVAIFRAWHDAGVLDAGPDPETRAAIAMSADFGLIFLREQWTEILGTDPLGDGMQRWTEESMRVYAAIWPDPPSPPAKES
ncbi:TetR family transcriptional regulator [Marihabitans asiaticum]|uniref:TetR family transcriptional regulator n=2 Tax=Marihabitans asiaticum TaxID=415218 RepID=A0A560WH83_9MICO|nr:TetR family transcriptional regulator [Marihabitans asiaticum]